MLSIPGMHTGARLAVLSCLVWVTVTAAEPTPVPPSISPEVTALAASQAKITTLIGDFRWLTGTVDGSGEVRERLGDFAVIRGKDGARNQYNVKLAAADGSDMHRWCSDGTDTFEIEQLVQDDPPQRRKLKPGAQDVELDRVVACVLLDLTTLSRDFTITLATVDGVRSLTFLPLGALKEELTRIVVTLDGDDPKEVVIDDARNTRIRLVIQHLVKDKELPAILFRPIPKD